MFDVKPTPGQRKVMQALAWGYNFVLEVGGRRCIVAQLGAPVSWSVIYALIRRKWITAMPGYPLLDPPVSLTERGRAALKL